MNTKNNTPLIVAFIVVAALFLLFGGGAMTGGMMQSGVHGGGWMDERSWMWIPAFLALVLGLALGWALVRKKE